MDYFLNKTEKARRSVDVPIPFNCSFSIAGIAGIKLYDYFTIDYLPELYRKYAVFQVTSVGHQLDESGWVTSISGMMRVDMDTLAKDTGYEVPDKIKDKIKYIEETKWIEVLNETLRNTTTENKEKEKGDSDVDIEVTSDKYETKSDPIAKITLPLGKVEVLKFNTDVFVKAMPQQELSSGDIIKTAPKSRVEILHLGRKGNYKIRVVQESEYVVTADNLRLMGKSFEGTVKKGNVWVAAKATFGQKEDVNRLMPTAVAAIRG